MSFEISIVINKERATQPSKLERARESYPCIHMAPANDSMSAKNTDKKHLTYPIKCFSILKKVSIK